MYTGPVEPGSTHDLTAARLHVLPALYRSAWLGMPVLADKGYQGAGIGVLTPTKNPCPTPDEQTRNNLLSALRAPAERANAMFKHFKALQRVSPGPRRHHRDHGRRPRHHHPLARFLTRILVRKAHCTSWERAIIISFPGNARRRPLNKLHYGWPRSALSTARRDSSRMPAKEVR